MVLSKARWTSQRLLVRLNHTDDSRRTSSERGRYRASPIPISHGGRSEEKSWRNILSIK